MGSYPLYHGQFLAPHWAARHKQMLGWLDAGKHVLDVVSNGTFRLAPINSSSDSLKALRVRRFSQGDQWFWIEYRQPLGFDTEVALVAPQAFTGVLVHYDDPVQPTLPESTALLDFTADSTPHDFTDPALASGKSWTDAQGNLTIQVSGADSNGISVNVRFTPPCVSASSTVLSHSYLAQSGVLSFTAPPSCSWSAQSAASWITIVGTSSGTGSGSITYRLEANDAPNAAVRSGIIYVGGLAFTITQDRLITKPAAEAPILGPGTDYEKTLIFRFSDPRGLDDLNMLLFYFNGAHDVRSCVMNISPFASRLIWIADDATGSFIDPVAAGTPGTLQNALCAIDASTVTVETAGNVATVTLPVLFSPAFNGTIRAYGRAYDKSGGDDSGPEVNWNVAVNRCVRSVIPGALQVAAQAGTTTLQVDAEAGCPWIFTSEDSWVSLSSPLSRFSGPQKIIASIAANTAATPRINLLYFGGQPVSVMQAGAAASARPVIAQKGVVHGAAYNRWIASSGWVAILGANLSPVTRLWRESDFVGNRLPASLDGVSVKINGNPAYIYYISPGQINVLAPENPVDGKVKVEVTTPAGTSESSEVRMVPVAPGFFNFTPDGGRYVAAVHLDGTYVGKPGLFQGVTLSPASPGETILLFATGLGATNPPAPIGTVPSAPLPLSTPVSAWLGGVWGTVSWAGLISPGLYQLNFVVPAVRDGDHQIQIRTGGGSSQGFAFLTVQKQAAVK